MFKDLHHYNLPAMFIVLVALFIGVIPFPFLGNIFVPWFLTFIVLWQVDNDYKFNPIFIFFTALVFDFLTGGLLGMSPLVLLILSRVVYNNRFILRGQTFNIKWMSFSVLVLVAFVIEYIISSMAIMRLVNAVPFALNFILLALTYPIFYKLFRLTESYE